MRKGLAPNNIWRFNTTATFSIKTVHKGFLAVIPGLTRNPEKL
jgi:hypothetical protein